MVNINLGTNVSKYDNLDLDEYEMPELADDSNTSKVDDAGQPKLADDAKDVERKLGEGQINTTDLIKGANVNALSKQARDLNSNPYRTKRSLGHELLTGIGRFLMNAVHVAKSIFCLDVLRPSWWRNNVRSFSNKATNEANPGNVRYKLPEVLADGKRIADIPTIAFDKDLVAVGTGFTLKEKNNVAVNVKVKEFSKPVAKDSLYPSGRPCLKDIAQNPDLQDCWFLSGIASLLKSQGPDAIERLIKPNDAGDGWIVRLGTRHIAVPNGEVQCNGKGCVSNSAPWVKVLEQAVAMHLGSGKDSIDIFYNSACTAQLLLQGADIDLKNDVLPSYTVPAHTAIDVNKLKIALEHHVPVEIGHVDKSVSIGGKIAGVLRDNISPGHAVALMDVQVRGNGKAWLTVMDPYGKTRIISSTALTRCGVTFGCTAGDAKNLGLTPGVVQK